MSANAIAGLVAAAWIAPSPAAAQDASQHSPLESLARSAGLVATPPDPPDFVKATRPKTEPSSIPIFATPEEPPSKVKSAAELKAMDADLERASGRARGTEPGAKRKARPPRPTATKSPER